jgi:SAM-dependent methyltransferase
MIALSDLQYINYGEEMKMGDRSRWDKKYLQPYPVDSQPPASFLEDNIDLIEACIPVGSRTLDLAAGEGRNSLFLASRGFKVDAVDFSLEGLRRIRQRATTSSLKVQTVVVDLDHFTVSPCCYSFIINFFFLQRSLFESMAEGLRPGGLLIFETYTTLHQQLNPERRMRRNFLLEPGELEHAFPTLELLAYREEGETARLLACKPQI